MAASLIKNTFFISGSMEIELFDSKRSSSMGFLRFAESKTSVSPMLLKNEFKGRQVVVSDQSRFGHWRFKGPANFSVCAQRSICVSQSLRWWDKTLKPNMVEINSAQELVDSLLNAGDNLVIIDFYSPGCGGCKALHPKICQFAELNSTVIFLKVNHEKLRTMCKSLNIHVLPFFRFYRGAEGRLCSFSCTNATIKKFKDALAKHGTDRCSLGPVKGLEESELLKLASNKEISLNLPTRSMSEESIKYIDPTVTNISSSDKIGKNEVVEKNAVLMI